MIRTLTYCSIVGCLFFALGCSKKPSTQPSDDSMMQQMMQQETQRPMGNMSMGNMPMMKGNHPMNTKEVTGQIQAVNQTELVVFTTKGVSLKFNLDKNTVIQPKGTKLTPGLKVNVHIQAIAMGMNAAEVDVIK